MLIRGKNNKFITFVCDLNLNANEVYLTGNFNQWQPKLKQMLKAKDGSFRIIMNLPPGQYQYKYIVDGIWHNDPDAPHLVKNNTGELNGAFEVRETTKYSF